MYLRQLDVPGVDTKFIERHRAVLGELLEPRRVGPVPRPCRGPVRAGGPPGARANQLLRDPPCGGARTL